MTLPGPSTLGLLIYRIRVEEEALSSTFGPAYADYRRNVKALLPGLL